MLVHLIHVEQKVGHGGEKRREEEDGSRMKAGVARCGALFVQRNFAGARLNHRVKLVLVVVIGGPGSRVVVDIGDGAPSVSGRCYAAVRGVGTRLRYVVVMGWLEEEWRARMDGRKNATTRGGRGRG